MKIDMQAAVYVTNIHGRFIQLYVRVRPCRPGNAALYDVCVSVDGVESVLLESATDSEFAYNVLESYIDGYREMTKYLAGGGR